MKDIVDGELFGVGYGEWLIVIALALVVSALLRFLKSTRGKEKTQAALAELKQLREERVKTRREILQNLLERTSYVAVILVAAYLTMEALGMPASITSIGKMLTQVALFLQVGWWGDGLIDRWFGAPARQTMPGGARLLVRVTMWVVLLLLALENLGVDLSAAIAGLGITGVAVAIATQKVLGDLFAFLSITSDEPFVVGDYVVVGELSGTVEDIGLRSTRLRSLNGEELIISNSDMLSSRIQNYKTLKSRRIVSSFGVVHDTPRQKLAAIPGYVREVIGPLEFAYLDRAHFKNLGESSFEFEIVYYIRVPDYSRYMDIREQINLGLLSRFEEEGITLAHPMQTIQIEGGGPTGDRLSSVEGVD